MRKNKFIRYQINKRERRGYWVRNNRKVKYRFGINNQREKGKHVCIKGKGIIH
jgi:hypothetical protein